MTTSAARHNAKAICTAIALLTYGAAPTFLMMALATITLSDVGICSAIHQPIGPMTQMYLLMTAFHASPWLKLLQQSPGTRHPGLARTDADN